MRSLTLTFFAAAIAFGCTASSPVQAVDVREVIAETQRTSANPGTSDLVWWIPTEFWRASLANEPSVTAELLSQFEATLAPYVMFAVVHGKIGPFAGVSWTPEADLLPTIKLTGPGGEVHRPLEASGLSPDAKNLSGSLRPVLVNMLGPMGQNMHFVFFSAKDSSGAPLADPLNPGEFSFGMMDETYSWRLPLGSLLPKKHCPVDGEALNGAWQFCPWHGKKLKSQ